MDINQLLIGIVQHTDGWVLLIIFALFLTWKVYQEHQSGKTEERLINTLDSTLAGLMAALNDKLGSIAEKLEHIIKKS